LEPPADPGRFIQHGCHISNTTVERVGRYIVWFVTSAMPARIDQDQPVFRPQRRNIAVFKPILDTACEAMLKHQWRTGTLKLVVDLGSIIVRIWHAALLFCFC
jgi:hypothetical protein